MPRPVRSRSQRAAQGGVLAAGSLVVLFLAGWAPSGRLGLTAAAGLFPMAAVLAGGRSAGYLCWGASALLGLILLPDKGLALLYLVFFGLYPVAKSGLESRRSRALAWLLKLGYCSGVLALCRCALKEWIPPVQGWMFFLLGNLIFIVYDAGLSQLIARLVRRRR
ncbi:MAG: hypothetical protein HFF50_03500 [Lawsonibacter sp.]|nr:hypothetical protein [Lawsonibacter sp.]